MVLTRKFSKMEFTSPAKAINLVPPKFGIAADPIILDRNKVLLVKRSYEPFKGKYDFPGGFLEEGETIEQTCVREAKEETGLDVEPVEILGVYSKIGRDPRGQTLSVSFICKPKTMDVKISNEATEAEWFDLDKINKSTLAFDFAKTIEDLKKWKKQKGTYWSTK